MKKHLRTKQTKYFSRYWFTQFSCCIWSSPFEWRFCSVVRAASTTLIPETKWMDTVQRWTTSPARWVVFLFLSRSPSFQLCLEVDKKTYLYHVSELIYTDCLRGGPCRSDGPVTAGDRADLPCETLQSEDSSDGEMNRSRTQDRG